MGKGTNSTRRKYFLGAAMRGECFSVFFYLVVATKVSAKADLARVIALCLVERGHQIWRGVV
jgi:hypothetical protein